MQSLNLLCSRKVLNFLGKHSRSGSLASAPPPLLPSAAIACKQIVDRDQTSQELHQQQVKVENLDYYNVKTLVSLYMYM